MSRRRWGVGLVLTVAVGAMGSALLPASAADEPATRSPRAWPFAQNSIWNMPIGSDAVYKDADLQPATAAGPTTEEDLLILRPDAPRQDVIAHDAGWDGDRTRCGSVVSPTRVVLADMPIPSEFVTDPGYLGRTPNHSTAILAADGRTVKETQPFHRCSPGGPAVSQFTFGEQDLMTGDGIRGSHGGSGMSALGGTIRVGELRPGATLRHALKINLWGKENLHCSAGEADGRPGFRWPALQADGGACDPDSFNSYDADDPGVQMGTLLALPPGFDVASLRTEPARIIAQAMQDYGAYIVDNTGWDVSGLAMEWGPDGRVRDEVANQWGVHFDANRASPQNQATADFIADFDQLFAEMNYIDNNGPGSIGGGGTPRAPLAPAFDDGSGGGSNPPPGNTGAIVGFGDKCLDVLDGRNVNGQKTQLWPCNGLDAQRWTLPGDGTIRAVGGCLDVAGGATGNGTSVRLWECNGAGAQQWQVHTDQSIRNPQSGRCLDAAGASSADGTPTQLWDCHGGGNQRWRITA